MSAIGLPTVAVTLDQVSEETLAAELRARGWRVQRDDGKGWVTPSAASLEIGRHDSWISKLLSRGVKPPGLETERTPAGRLIRVRMSPEFKAWAAARVEPQPRLAL